MVVTSTLMSGFSASALHGFLLELRDRTGLLVVPELEGDLLGGRRAEADGETGETARW
jgi:hypothetical protein